MTAEDAAARFRSVTKRFGGTTAVHDASFSVRSGAGKTTSLPVRTGLMQAA